MVDCCAIIRVFKVFKIFQNKRTIAPNYLKNLSELLVFMEELIIKKNQWFYCRLFDFLKKFDNHGYLRIFVFFNFQITVMNLKSCPNDTRGGGFVVAFCPDIGFSQYTRWGGSSKFLKFDLHAGYQYIFFPDFLDQCGINILEWPAHQDINILFLLRINNYWICIRAGFCNNLLRTVQSDYAYGLIFS